MTRTGSSPQPTFRPLEADLLAPVDPALHTDHAVGRPRLREAVGDVGPQGGQRQPALEIPLRAGDLVAAEPARDADLDSLRSEPLRGFDRLAPGAAERDAL